MTRELTTRLVKKSLLCGSLTGAPNPATDALEVTEANWNPDVQQIERNIVSGSLSNPSNQIGSKKPTMTFAAELKGNGRVQSGSAADQPLLARFFAACGFAILGASTPADQVLSPIAGFANPPTTPLVAWAVGGPVTLTRPMLYRVRVTTPGASGTAKVKVIGNDPFIDDTSDDVDQTVTSGTAINLGTSGAKVTPTFAGILPLGASWSVLVMPVGLRLKPISGAIVPYIELHLYKDGQVHKMPQSRGTFKITAAGGDIAKVEFTFQGAYAAPLDAPTPTVAYTEGTTLPPMVEFSNLTWGEERDLVAQQWTFDMANTVAARMDVNADDSLRGYRITARKPVGGFNPEATVNADYDFYKELENGTNQTFFAKVGNDVGNTTCVFIPRAQLSSLPYGDRDGVLTYDISFAASQVAGDDEVYFVFC